METTNTPPTILHVSGGRDLFLQVVNIQRKYNRERCATNQWLIVEGEQITYKPVKDQGRWEENETGEGVGIGNKDEVTHPLRHRSFANNAQAHLQALHRHHSHCYCYAGTPHILCVCLCKVHAQMEVLNHISQVAQFCN